MSKTTKVEFLVEPEPHDFKGEKFHSITRRRHTDDGQVVDRILTGIRESEMLSFAKAVNAVVAAKKG